MNQKKLQQELRAERVSNDEIQQLAEFARQLSNSELPHLTQRGRARIESRLPVDVSPRKQWYKTPLMIGFTSSFAVCMIIITLAAQTAPTTSPLYNIKRGTDFIRGLWSEEKSPEPSTDTKLENMQQSTRSPQSEREYVPEETPQTSEAPTENRDKQRSSSEENTSPWRRTQRNRDSSDNRDETSRYQSWWRW